MPTLLSSATLDNVPGASGASQAGHLVFAVNATRWYFFTWAGKLASGTASATSTTAHLIDTTQSWTTGQWLGRTCIITGGTGAGESFVIGNNTATTLPVVDDAGLSTIATAPNATSTYEIVESGTVHAYVSSGSDLSSATWSEATGSPTPDINSGNAIGFGIGVPGGSNNVGGSGQYPTDGRMLQVGYADVGGVDVFLLGVQIDSHYFQVTLRGRLTAATTIAWDGVISGTTDTWNDTAPGMDCVPQFPDGLSLGYSSTGKWWQIQDQNGRVSVGYAANSADPGTANFNENWQGNNGGSAPTSWDTGGGDMCQSALIPLASGFMLAVYCNGNTASPAGSGNATQTGLRFAESASATQWPTTSTGAAVPNLSSTTNDPNDWGIVARTNTDIHVVRRNGSTAFEQVRYTGHGGSWGAKVNLPTTGLTGHLAGSGVALVSDGTSVWAFLIDTDANHSVRYVKWTSAGGWASSWSTLTTGTEAKNFISAYMRSDGLQIGVVWTANSSSPFQVNFAALSLGAAGGATWAPQVGVARGPFFMSGRQATVWAWPTSVTVQSSTADPVSGAATASTSGALGLAESLSGTSSAVGASSGSAALAESASGTSTALGSASGALTLAEAAGGTSATPAPATGLTALQVASSGTSASVAPASGVLALVEAASGTGTGVSAGNGALATSISATGSSQAVSAGSGASALAESMSGAAAAVSTATGSAALAESLSGTSSAVSSASAAAAEAVSSSGTSSSVAAGSGVLQALTGASMQGTSSGVSSTTGFLALAASAAGSPASPAASSGALALVSSTSGVSAEAATASGSLGLAVATSGTSSSVGAGSGSVALSASSGGTSNGAGAVSGSLALALALAGASAAVASGSGTLQATSGAALSGVSASVSTSTGALVLAATLAGASSGVAQALGVLALVVALSGRVDGRATAAGSISGLAPGPGTVGAHDRLVSTVGAHDRLASSVGAHDREP